MALPGPEMISFQRSGPGKQGGGVPGRLRAAGPSSSLPPMEARVPSETTLANVTAEPRRCCQG